MDFLYNSRLFIDLLGFLCEKWARRVVVTGCWYEVVYFDNKKNPGTGFFVLGS